MSSAHPPISFADVTAARTRLRAHFPMSPAMTYPLLDDLVGQGIRVWVKHDNHLPVSTFKVRNATSALTALVARDPDAARRGVAAATTGNHGQGLAWAGARLGVPVTICVPVGNNPEKNASIRSYGARLITRSRRRNTGAGRPRHRAAAPAPRRAGSCPGGGCHPRTRRPPCAR